MRMPLGARNGTTGMPSIATRANCLNIGAATVPPWT
jgi:hypothetical protein